MSDLMTQEYAPLYSLEAEQSVIGACLLDSRALDDAALLKEADFFDPMNRKTWRAMQSMQASGEAVDAISVESWLDERGESDINTLAYLVTCVQNVQSSANIGRYVAIVRERAAQRAMATALDQAAMAIREPGSAVGERIDRAMQLVTEAVEKREIAEPRSLREVLMDCLTEFNRRYEGDSQIHGLPTGFVDLDSKTGGLKGGNLVIVAGRPGMGKSTFAFNVAENVARHGGLVLAFTLEMSSMEQGFRTLASLGGIRMDALNSGAFGDEDWDRLGAAVNTGSELRFFLDERTDISIAELRATARRMKRKNGLDLIVLDYIGLMVRDNSNAVAEISNITRGLKLLAKELDIPVIALAQLNRGVEQRTDKRPLMSDLRDSGSIEQDADIVLMMYRDDYYHEHSPVVGFGECLIRKQRNGPTGAVALKFEGQHARYLTAVQHEYFNLIDRKPAGKSSSKGFDA